VTPIVVAAAVIERAGALLLTRRLQGVHLEGFWEFPGGKREPGETLAECLVREIREELGVEARVGGEIFATTHTYPEHRVELHFLTCDLEGEPAPQLGQDMRWVPRHELGGLEFPQADAELIQLLMNGAGGK
jgi:8-oxo-dGTP diphosphatase